MLSKFYGLIKTQPIIHIFKQILTTEWHSKNNTSAYLSNRKKIPSHLHIEETLDSSLNTHNKISLPTLFFEYFQQPLLLCNNNQENFAQNKKSHAEEKPNLTINPLGSSPASNNCSEYLSTGPVTTAIALLAEILSHYDLGSCYRAEIYPKFLERSADILLRASTAFPPNQAQQLKFNHLLADLAKEQLLNFAADAIIVPIRGTNDKKYHLPVINIKIKDIVALKLRAHANLRETALNTQETLESTENISSGRINFKK